MITINERAFELIREAREKAHKNNIPEQAMNVFFAFYLANYAAKLERTLASSIEERTNEMIEKCRGGNL